MRDCPPLPASLALRGSAEGWPRISSAGERPAALIKQEPDDFVVEEIPAYEPSGQGEFCYVYLQKRGVAWGQAREAIVSQLGISDDELGAAGIKDRWAVTRHWISVPWSCAPRIEEIGQIEGLQVLSVARHSNKLRTGHLHGNRFKVRIRGLSSEQAEQVAQQSASLTAGVPNYYGEQRFGRGLGTLQLGWRALHGEFIRNRFRAKLAVSALQAALFNDVLARRLNDGLLHRVLLGDALSKTDTGGMFTSDDRIADQARLDRGELVPMGPIFGKKTFPVHHEAAAREAAVLADAGIAAEQLRGLGKLAPGTRRPLFVKPHDLSTALDAEGLVLSFSLPAGAYATVLLRELLDDALLEDASLSAPDEPIASAHVDS